MNTLSTGIESLDRQLNGGFNSGTTIALSTPPDAPSSAILQQLMTQRPTTYITTLRPRAALEDELTNLLDEDVNFTIEQVGIAGENSEALHAMTDSRVYSVNTTERERFLDEIYEIVEAIEDQRNVIIDPMNPLERSESRTAFQRLLQEISATIQATDGLGIFHCISLDEPPRLRETTMTMVDTVWNIEVITGEKGNLELKASIPKNRGGKPILEQVTLLLDKTEVYTDQSRAI